MLTIGGLARRTGCSVPTIRYYEQIGLIPVARRGSGGHRIFDATATQRLILIRRYRELGFPVEQVRALVQLSQSSERDCNDTLAIADQHLESVRAKLAELRALERSLVQLAGSCRAQCEGGPASSCSIARCHDT
jgi:MerR family transcriptional regulator, copper efflux regulator